LYRMELSGTNGSPVNGQKRSSMYKHWLTRLIAFILGVKAETIPAPDPEYLNKYLYPAVSDTQLSELNRDRWQD